MTHKAHITKKNSDMNYESAKIINTTPHVVRVQVNGAEQYREFHPEMSVRAAQELREVHKGTFEVCKVHYSSVSLPEPSENVAYIVSTIVANAAKASGRTTSDLLVPDSGPDCIRDERGQVFAVRRFIIV